MLRSRNGLSSAFTLLLAVITCGHSADRSNTAPHAVSSTAADRAIESSIDGLTRVSKQGVSFDSLANASGFAAVNGPPRFIGGILGTPATTTPSPLRNLVRIGLPALPHLLAHLGDRRKTRLTIKHDMGMGAMWFSDEMEVADYDRVANPAGVNDIARHPEKEIFDMNGSHTLTVGDLCFVAIGQIVNRSYNAVRYQMTACIVLNSPTHTPALAQAVRAEWQGLTPEGYRASLLRDAYNTGNLLTSEGALQRLCFYYPDTGERLTATMLQHPLYDSMITDDFVTQQLAMPPQVWKSNLDRFVRAHGKQYRDAVFIELHRNCVPDSPWEDMPEQVGKARKIMQALYPGSDIDRPGFVNATTAFDRSDLISCLNWKASKRIDTAVLAIFKELQKAKPDDEEAREGAIPCIERLSTRGYRIPCRRYCLAQIKYLSRQPSSPATDQTRDQYRTLLAKLK